MSRDEVRAVSSGRGGMMGGTRWSPSRKTIKATEVLWCFLKSSASSNIT